MNWTQHKWEQWQRKPERSGPFMFVAQVVGIVVIIGALLGILSNINNAGQDCNPAVTRYIPSNEKGIALQDWQKIITNFEKCKFISSSEWNTTIRCERSVLDTYAPSQTADLQTTQANEIMTTQLGFKLATDWSVKNNKSGRMIYTANFDNLVQQAMVNIDEEGIVYFFFGRKGTADKP